MRTGKVVLAAVAVLACGGPLEAASGGRLVRAAVRLEKLVDARVADVAMWARLHDETVRLVTGLRAVRQLERTARCPAYVVALAEVRRLDTAVAGNAALTGRPRVRVMRAIAALEHALARAARHGSRTCR